MRVALLHNPSAGGEDHDAGALREVIQGAGHELVHLVGGVGALTAALHEEPCDLVVVAGGDGTVGRAACALSGWKVPITILPLGTANNTAHSLDLSMQHEQAARSWHRARAVPFDLGLISDGTVRRHFAEAVGWGLFPSAIAKAQERGRGESVGHTLESDREVFRAVARASSPREYRIELDGKDLSGAYLLVEIMNVPLLGPRLPLSPSSDPADGLFELVLASDAHRAGLEALANGAAVTGPSAPRVERGAHIRVESSERVLHCDGKLWRHGGGGRAFEIDVDVGAVQYLAEGAA